MKGFALANRIAEAPYNKLESMMWAVIAMRAGGGQKEPPNVGMATDIKTVSRLLPTAMSCSLIENAGRYSRTSQADSSRRWSSGSTRCSKIGVPLRITQLRQGMSKQHIAGLSTLMETGLSVLHRLLRLKPSCFARSCCRRAPTNLQSWRHSL